MFSPFSPNPLAVRRDTQGLLKRFFYVLQSSLPAPAHSQHRDSFATYLTSQITTDDTLRHWPAVAAWRVSRLTFTGPTNELCDLVFVPISERSGLHRVHPTWAGAFVLAALNLIFPRLHLVLVDSDCVPVTLFAAAGLWREAQLAQAKVHDTHSQNAAQSAF